MSPKKVISVLATLILIAASTILLFGSPKVKQVNMLSARYQRMADYCEKAEATYLLSSDQFLSELDAFENKKMNKKSLSFIELSPPGEERISLRRVRLAIAKDLSIINALNVFTNMLRETQR